VDPPVGFSPPRAVIGNLNGKDYRPGLGSGGMSILARIGAAEPFLSAAVGAARCVASGRYPGTEGLNDLARHRQLQAARRP
jgi:hypothetical protein